MEYVFLSINRVFGYIVVVFFGVLSFFVGGLVFLSRIDYLLDKYDSCYVRGEVHSSETNLLIKQNQRRVEKHVLCDELIGEVNLSFKRDEVDFIHFLIDRFHNDFKKLHGRAKNEAIILSFMFYVKKLSDSRININNYRVCKKYNLFDSVFETVICHMCDAFVKSLPVGYVDTTKYNHEILSKNGGIA